MTLQELLNLKIVEDNVYITESPEGNKEYHINRIFQRPVTKEDVIKSGLPEEMLSYNVKAIFGSKWKFKIGIWIAKEE